MSRFVAVDRRGRRRPALSHFGTEELTVALAPLAGVTTLYSRQPPTGWYWVLERIHVTCNITNGNATVTAYMDGATGLILGDTTGADPNQQLLTGKRIPLFAGHRVAVVVGSISTSAANFRIVMQYTAHPDSHEPREAGQ